MSAIPIIAAVVLAGFAWRIGAILRNRAVGRAIAIAEKGGPFSDASFAAPYGLMVLALVCLSFGAYLAYAVGTSPNVQKEGPQTTVLIILLVDGLPSIVGLGLLAAFIKQKVVVSGDEVQIHGVLSTKSFSLSSVVGLDIEDPAHAVVNLSDGTNILLPLRYRRIDLLLATLLRHRPSGGIVLS